MKAVTWSKESKSKGTSVCYFVGSALQNLLEHTTTQKENLIKHFYIIGFWSYFQFGGY